MKRFYVLIVVLASILMLSANSSFAQLRYKVDFRMLMDNLEDAQPYTKPRTISGVLLTPEIGFSHGNHSLMVGVSLLERFGTPAIIDHTNFLAYYEYKDSKFKAIAGIYSAYEREPLPLSYYTSSSLFFNDKAQGLYGKYKNENGYIEMWVDWFKSGGVPFNNTIEYADRFKVGVSGERWWHGARLKGSFVMGHYGDRPTFETFGVFDHIQYDLNAGYDFARHQDVFSKLLITAGISGDMNRARNDADKGFEMAAGFQSEQLIEWKGVSLHNTVYTGKGQMGYYQQFPFIYTGSPFYQADFHDMLIAKYTYNYKWLSVSASFVFYFTPETVSNQQMVSVSFKLDDVIKFKSKK